MLTNRLLPRGGTTLMSNGSCSLMSLLMPVSSYANNLQLTASLRRAQARATHIAFGRSGLWLGRIVLDVALLPHHAAGRLLVIAARAEPLAALPSGRGLALVLRHEPRAGGVAARSVHGVAS